MNRCNETPNEAAKAMLRNAPAEFLDTKTEKDVPYRNPNAFAFGLLKAPITP